MNAFINQILTVCSLITAVGAVIALAVQAVKKAKSPNALQNERISNCEEEIKKIKTNLARDLDRFEEIENGNTVIMTAILALLSHGIDGNDIQSMKDAREEMQDYLIKGRVKRKGV